jgi:hypothetical protein
MVEQFAAFKLLFYSTLKAIQFTPQLVLTQYVPTDSCPDSVSAMPILSAHCLLLSSLIAATTY